jgi:hypothetical protein
MENPKNGAVQPAIGEQDEGKGSKVYKTADGGTITVTAEEFAAIVEIFRDLRAMRDLKVAHGDTLEPKNQEESTTKELEFELKRKAG